MALTALYMRKGGAEDLFLDAATHSVPVSSTTNRNVTGLAAYFHRIDGTGTAGTGDWETSGKMTASYFVATHATTYSDLPKLLASTTLRVVSASVLEVDATSLECGVAANFAAAVTVDAAVTAVSGGFGGTIPAGSETLKAESLRATTAVVTGTSTLTGAVSAGSTLAVTGATTLSSTLAVTGATTHTGAVALNGGATVPSGQTLTIASGATLTISGTLGITTLTATTATIAGASGGSEALRTTTFRATGASVFTNTISASGAVAVSGNLTASAQVDMNAQTNIGIAGQLNINGISNLFTVPSSSDTSTSASLDLDNLDTPNSHQFGPSGARAITSVSGAYSGVYWFINAHGSNDVTIASGYMNVPTGLFTLAHGERALLYWDKTNTKFTVISHD